MASKKQERVGLDARGLPILEERLGTGQFQTRERDMPAVRLLRADQLTLTEPPQVRTTGNPYGKLEPNQSLRARNKLDYMRALSEVIKAKRQLEGGGAPPHKQTSSLKRAIGRVLRRKP